MSEVEILEDQVRLVVFTAGGQEYGLEIDQVQEIIRPLPVTRVPGAPGYIEGVVNLRGNVVPVVNLHRRLALGQRTDSPTSRIIIVNSQDITGIIVDSVREVLGLPKKCIERKRLEPPAGTSLPDMAHLGGIGKNRDRIILLLDLDSVLGIE